MDKFDRGEDIYRSATLTIDDTAADTADFLTIEVVVRHKFTQVTLDTYTKADSEVETPDPTSGGVITFIVPVSKTTIARVGTYEYEATTTETDTDYEDNTRTRKFVGDCFFLNP